MNNNNEEPKTPSEALRQVEAKMLRLLAAINSKLGQEHLCPKCFEDMGKHPAISRRDNKTKICSQCGVNEAMEDAFDLQIECDAETNRFKTRIVMTHGVEEFPEDFVKSCLARHANKDWGDLCDEDKRANDKAVIHGGRVLSSYELRGDKLWIITEADRSVTTILTPDEY